MKEEEAGLTLAEVEQCLAILKLLNDDSGYLVSLPENCRVELLKEAGRLSRPDRDEFRKRQKEIRQFKKTVKTQNDRAARAITGIRAARISPVFEAPKMLSAGEGKVDPGVLSSPRNCYICKKEYTQLHHFYDTMCRECGDFNYMKRFQTADLTGKVAIITGSRLKIGYHTTLMMLRAGATVIATTRFPVDSALRFSKEVDFPDWSDRLKIHGLDLRHIPSVELFANHIAESYERLDILINNAAQTVRRPPGFYAHLMVNESHHEINDDLHQLLQNHQLLIRQLKPSGHIGKEAGDQAIPVTWHGQEPGIGIRASARLSQIPYRIDHSIDPTEIFPEGKLDSDLQQVDLRKTNSWRLRLGEVPTAEMIEVQLVNAVAPFVLVNRLVTLMRKDYTGQKHIINVSAMEGKFHRFKKEDRHPHTNMAKAALNMMTHTAAGDFAKDGIYMNAVDTGWVTDEDPAELSQRKVEVHDFQPPLDIVDGAARVIDPLFDGINTGQHWCGKFLKDYFPIDW